MGKLVCMFNIHGCDTEPQDWVVFKSRNLTIEYEILLDVLRI